MSFIETVKAKAKSLPQTIVLPESQEPRNLEAAEKVLREGIAKIILLGKREEIMKAAQGRDLAGATFIDPLTDPKRGEYIETLVELRKAKGMTAEKADEYLRDPVNYGVMLVKKGVANGMVSGAVHATADIMRPALQIIKTAPGIKLVSAAFIMVLPEPTYGADGIFLFSDAALNPNPTAEELAHIAISSAETFRRLVGKEPIVAMLSFSTRGSASHPDVEKVTEAVKIAKGLAPNLALDGEMQLDAAVVPKVGKLKAPDSPVAGKANVLVFPDLDAANIGYKLVQRLANADAMGPVTQGLAKPMNDLSRGCSADDIVGTIALTAVQAQQQG